MIQKLDEFDMYVAIAGFRNAKIGDVEVFFNLARKNLQDVEAVQFFRAELIATWQHLYFAAINALTAFANKTNYSSSLAMETLLHAAAQRQIQKATKSIGIQPETADVAVLVLAKNVSSANKALKQVQKLTSAKPDDSALEITQEKFVRIKRFFKISDVEFSSQLKRKGLEEEALVDLVIEHGALLATQR